MHFVISSSCSSANDGVAHGGGGSICASPFHLGGMSALSLSLDTVDLDLDFTGGKSVKDDSPQRIRNTSFYR